MKSLKISSTLSPLATTTAIQGPPIRPRAPRRRRRRRRFDTKIPQFPISRQMTPILRKPHATRHAALYGETALAPIYYGTAQWSAAAADLASIHR